MIKPLFDDLETIQCHSYVPVPAMNSFISPSQ